MGDRLARLALVLSAVALIATACSGDPVDESGDDDTIVDLGDDDDSDDGSGTGDRGDSSGDDERTGDSGSGTDFMTVFGIPPWPSVETDWSPYVRNETEFGVDQSVVFEVRDATVDELVAYYLSVIADLGYLADDPLELGGTIAINISDPE